MFIRGDKNCWKRKKFMNKLNINDLPQFLIITEVAELLRVSIVTLKRWGKKGKLVPLRINSRGDRRYNRDSILKHLGIKKEVE